MTQPDFDLSRRQLRRARIEDALSLERKVIVQRHRDRLLELLARDSTNLATEFDSLSEATVDTVISLASVSLDESPEDALIVQLLSIEVLAADGQFARLTLLADGLRYLARNFQVERPFKALALDAFRLAIRGREAGALLRLEEVLGVDAKPRNPRHTRTREQLSDLLGATALRSVLRRTLGESEEDLTQPAREAATRTSDGALLAFVDAIAAWGDAVMVARPAAVLTESDPIFQSKILRPYLEKLNIAALFPAQVRAIESGVTLDEDKMVALPTSSGKTLIAEFRIAASLARSPGSKAIYVAPYRLLARQVEAGMSRRLAALGLSVRDLGSGYDPTGVGADELADVIVCTPERLDGLLRLATSDEEGRVETARLFEQCSVLVFDELHLIGRHGRGPRFELLLARIRSRLPGLRVLGLSAATLGAGEMAEWLGDDDPPSPGAKRPTGTLEIVWQTDGTLRQRVSERNPTKVAHLPRSRAVDDAASLILRLGPRHSPALAICVNRMIAENLAGRLRATAPAEGLAWREGLTDAQSEELAEAIEEVRALLGKDHPLAQHMEVGIAFHHAGVPTHVLQQIERLAAKRLLRVVAATTTVAEGADLPFRVVVVPHINFPGRSGRLERDLYLNIIGRAGRANVSVEGIVFILESDARTLRNLVHSSLWSPRASDRVRGKLAQIDAVHSNEDEWTEYLELQSQVMGWLGDGASYVADQPTALASRTFSYFSGSQGEQRRIEQILGLAMSDLESRGLAIAGSPYRLTERGRSARMTGLAAPSVARLESAIHRASGGWLASLEHAAEVSHKQAQQVAALVFEATEVFEHSLWLRRRVSGEKQGAKLRALQHFAYDHDSTHVDSETFAADVDLLSRWMMGESYQELAERAPVFRSAQSLFGGTDAAKRVSDATEYVGKLTYPASWVWSAVQVLAKRIDRELPTFVRGAIEFGLPSEGAVQLALRAGLTRSAAMAVVHESGQTWNAVRGWMLSDRLESASELGLTRADLTRLGALRDRLELEELL